MAQNQNIEAETFDDNAPTEQPVTGVNLQNNGSDIDVTNEQTQNDRLGKLITNMLATAPAGTAESVVADCCLQLLQAYDLGNNLQVTTPYGQQFDTVWAGGLVAGM